MAKYKVLKTFRDKETKEVHEEGKEITFTVKRAEEAISRLGEDFLERIDEKANEDKTKK